MNTIFQKIKKAVVYLKRISVIYYFKLLKQSGTPEYIARGVGLGLFIGLLMPFGTQIATVLPLAIIFKAAKIPAVAFTWVTNHFTIFVIYPVQCFIGSYLVGNPLTYEHTKKMFEELLEHPSWRGLFDLGQEVVLAFFVGGLLFALLAGIPGYFVTLYLVRRHRRRREEKRRKLYGTVQPQ